MSLEPKGGAPGATATAHDGREEAGAGPPPVAPPRGGPAAGAAARSQRGSLIAVAERYGLVWMLLALIVFFAVWPETSETFTSATNIKNLVAGQAVIAVAALAALIPFLAGQFDLAIGAVAVGASVVLATLTAEAGVPLVPAVAITLVLATAIGVLSGMIVAYLRAQAIVITLGVATLVGGLVSLYTGNQSILGIPSSLTAFGSGDWLGIPRPVWVMVAVICAVGYLLRYTVTGRQLVMIGSNPDAARLVGVRRQRLILASFVMGAVLYGIAGSLLLARTGAANPGDGFGITLAALTAVFLGATTVRPGHFNVPGTIAGVFFIAVSVNGLTLAGVADWVNPVFTGASLVIAVAVSTVLAARRAT